MNENETFQLQEILSVSQSQNTLFGAIGEYLKI